MGTRLGATHLTRLRRAAGLTQEQLAEASGVSVRTLRSLESGSGGQPRRPTLERVAEALGLTGREVPDMVAIFAHDGHHSTEMTTFWPSFASVEEQEGDAPDVEDMLARMRRQRIVAQSVRWLCSPQAQYERFSVTATVQALEPGPGQRYLVQQYDPGRIDPRLISVVQTENCRLGATHSYPTANAKAFELSLEQVLEKDEYCTYGYAADFTRAVQPGVSSEPEYYMLAYAPGCLASIQVQFTAPAVPTRVRHVWRETGDAEPEHIADVPLNAFNTAQIVVESARRGFVGLVWEWPDLG